MIDSMLESRTRLRMTAVTRAARELDRALYDLDEAERRTLQTLAINAGGLAGDTLRSLASMARALDKFERDCTVNGRPAPRLSHR